MFTDDEKLAKKSTFYVYKEDIYTCVCGYHALWNPNDNLNIGYCKKCAQKREDFTNQIIGKITTKHLNVILSEDDIVNSQYKTTLELIQILENYRESIFREYFYYMIDKAYIRLIESNPNKDIYFTNQTPYEQTKFITQLYEENKKMMADFFNNIPVCLQSNPNNKVYNKYFELLTKKYDEDLDKVDYMNAILKYKPHFFIELN